MMLKTSENVFSIEKATQSYKNRKLSTSGGNGGIGNAEGRYDAIRGHRTGCNTSPPLSVPVNPSPVSSEASRDFVALDMLLYTRYQISKVNFWHYMVYLQLRQHGDESGDPPGRNRPARCGNPSPTVRSLIGWGL